MGRHRTSPYRIVESGQWHELLGLSDAAIMVYLFLRTGPFSTRLSGLVAAGPVLTAYQTDRDPEVIAKAFVDLEAAGLVRLDPEARVSYLPGVVGIDLPKNDNSAKGSAYELANIPSCSVAAEWFRELEALPDDENAAKRDRLIKAVESHRDRFVNSRANSWANDRPTTNNNNNNNTSTSTNTEEAFKGGRVQEGRGEKRELERAWGKTAELPDLGDWTAQLQDHLRTGDDGNAEALIQNAPLEFQPKLIQCRTMFMSRAAATPANEGI